MRGGVPAPVDVLSQRPRNDCRTGGDLLARSQTRFSTTLAYAHLALDDPDARTPGSVFTRKIVPTTDTVMSFVCTYKCPSRCSAALTMMSPFFRSIRIPSEARPTVISECARISTLAWSASVTCRPSAPAAYTRARGQTIAPPTATITNAAATARAQARVDRNDSGAASYDANACRCPGVARSWSQDAVAGRDEFHLRRPR